MASGGQSVGALAGPLEAKDRPFVLAGGTGGGVVVMDFCNYRERTWNAASCHAPAARVRCLLLLPRGVSGFVYTVSRRFRVLVSRSSGRMDDDAEVGRDAQLRPEMTGSPVTHLRLHPTGSAAGDARQYGADRRFWGS